MEKEYIEQEVLIRIHLEQEPGEYDRATKKYVLIDCNDVWGNGRLVKGTTPANDDFTY